MAPVFLGDLVTFYTRTIKFGRTSITVDVEVEVERLGPHGNKEIHRVTEAEVVFVSVDEQGAAHTRQVMMRKPGLHRRRDESHFPRLLRASTQHSLSIRNAH